MRNISASKFLISLCLWMIRPPRLQTIAYAWSTVNKSPRVQMAGMSVISQSYLSLIASLYLPRKVGGRGLKSVENEYNLTKIKTAVNLYQNQDPKMKVVSEFEERATETGHHSLIKDAVKYAKELDLDLKLSELNPTCRTADGNEASGKQNW